MVYRGRDILLSKLSHQSRTVASDNEAVSALSAEGLNIEPPGLTVPLVVFQKYRKARIQLGYVNGAVVCVLSRWIVDLSTRQGACACACQCKWYVPRSRLSASVITEVHDLAHPRGMGQKGRFTKAQEPKVL